MRRERTTDPIYDNPQLGEELQKLLVHMAHFAAVRTAAEMQTFITGIESKDKSKVLSVIATYLDNANDISEIKKKYAKDISPLLKKLYPLDKSEKNITPEHFLPFKTITDLVTPPDASVKVKKEKEIVRKNARVTAAMAELLVEMYAFGIFGDGTLASQKTDLETFLNALRGNKAQLEASPLLQKFIDKMGGKTKTLERVLTQIPEVIEVDLQNEKPIEALRHIDRYEKDPAYQEVMELFRIMHVHPLQDKEPMVSMYTGTILLDRNNQPDDFRNIGEHCLVVGRVAEVMCHIALLLEEQRIKAVQEALGHDVNKPDEISRVQATKTMKKEDYLDNPNLVDPYSEDAYLGLVVRLTNARADIGIHQAIEIASAGKWTAHPSFEKFVSYIDGKVVLNPQRTFAQKIVHYADDSVYTQKYDSKKPDVKPVTHILTVDERQRGSDFWNTYKFLYEQGFGFDDRGNVVMVEDCSNPPSGLNEVHTYFYWQQWIAKEIAKEFVEQFCPYMPVGEDPEKYLKKRINEMY